MLQLGRFHQQVRNFYVVNEYGQHLRKMRANRLEIVFEHSQDIEGPWQEYGFRYKPWSETETLHFAGNHFPIYFQYFFIINNKKNKLGPYFARLDHQLYNAATSNYRDQLWTVSTAYRLLQNNQHVLRLLGQHIDKSIEPPPKYVRAVLYKFKFTRIADQ